MTDLRALLLNPLRRRRLVRLAATAAVMAAALTGCSAALSTPAAPQTSPEASSPAPASGSPSASPSSPATSPSAAAASASAPAVGLSPAPTHLVGPTGSPGTIDTAAGKVWDALPASFPIYPGLEPAPQPGVTESASLAMPGDRVSDLVDWYAAALALAGYDVGAPSPALEDGSRSLRAHRTDQAGCAVDVTVAPKGTMTFVSLAYGAGCSFS